MPEYSIQQLAREFEITPRAIRFYEDKGLINPKRHGITRVFSERDRVRLGLTVRGKRLGFTLEEIREIIDMYDPMAPGDAAQLLLLCQRIGEHRKELINKINDIKDTLNLMNDVEGKALKALVERQQTAGGQQTELDL